MRPPATTTVVIADTESYDLAGIALHTTLQQFPATEVIVFSDDPARWDGFGVIPVPKIAAIADYNRIVLERLPHVLRTDFALLVQYDGFAINRAAFTEDFYDYDYIGAPWPASMFADRGALVGNGGFSLRSRRLIEAVADYAERIDFETEEDVTLCVQLRDALEVDKGIRFAPVEAGRRFSVELDIVPGLRTFGFHGLHLLPRLYRDAPELLLSRLPARCLRRGSDQLAALRFGFSRLDVKAQSLLESRVSD